MVKSTRRPRSKAARNERRKAPAATFNTIGVAFLVAAVLQPVALGRALDAGAFAIALIAFIAFQFALHYVLERLED